MRTDSVQKTGTNTIKALRDNKGSILLEFAFSMTILAVIFMAAVTFSFLFSDYYSIQKVAREGAREASITMNEDRARARALQAAWLWGLDPGSISVDFYRSGKTETCVVRYTAIPFSSTFPTLVNGSPLRPVNLSAAATFLWSESK